MHGKIELPDAAQGDVASLGSVFLGSLCEVMDEVEDEARDCIENTALRIYNPYLVRRRDQAQRDRATATLDSRGQCLAQAMAGLGRLDGTNHLGRFRWSMSPGGQAADGQDSCRGAD